MSGTSSCGTGRPAPVRSWRTSPPPPWPTARLSTTGRSPPLRRDHLEPPAATATIALSVGEELLALLYDPAFVYRQYDHQLFLNTVVGPGEGDATVLKLAAPGIAWTGKGLALSSTPTPGGAPSPPAGAGHRGRSRPQHRLHGRRAPSPSSIA